MEASFNLAARMDELGERIERHWGLRVELRKGQVHGELPEDLGHQTYFIIHEAVINVARHAQATTVQVELSEPHNHLRIIVADNGCGFPFRGHYDLATLTAMSLGPRTLKERIASLGGTLVIDSSESGTRLDITLPLLPAGE
jgi:signal transduction histidine kinase